jgi:hypothetical protein
MRGERPASGRRRISRAQAKPSMSGMRQSSSTRPNGGSAAVSAASAAWPPSTDAKAKPNDSR